MTPNLPLPERKFCTRCKTVKPISEFRSRYPHGFQPWCIPCKNTYTAAARRNSRNPPVLSTVPKPQRATVRAEDHPKLIWMWNSGEYTVLQIAAEFDTHPHRIHLSVSNLRKAGTYMRYIRQPTQQAKSEIEDRMALDASKTVRRACLGCGRQIQSSGPGNRLCAKCASRKDDNFYY